MSKPQHNLLSPTHFHAVDAATCEQTIKESDLDFSICMGRFTIHQGHRYGVPIVIAEHHDQKTDELSAVWYDDGHGDDRANDHA